MVSKPNRLKLLVTFSLSLFLIMNAYAVFSFELNTGAQDSAPKYFMKDGEMTGLCVEIIHALEKENPNIRIAGYNKFFPFKRIKLNLEK
ncbi:hypothetical protein H0A36_07380 [Endozoicomonas sp. SM1973]|uniref:Solute-binding protein family 3/N-terminal domain-containing protein n=1 Tax=Spartinivicinus marinus TaxID=2994442 RepID=A0A853I2W0_9GAMM|nr:hypothetical protein [Spartinivicinus marinus]MCX4029260.1 hypothetical protein [Spartinivicinus marinus]NYZ65832.1 hypothetical protein [Spartinivicinus marinus]